MIHNPTGIVDLVSTRVYPSDLYKPQCLFELASSSLPLCQPLHIPRNIRPPKICRHLSHLHHSLLFLPNYYSYPEIVPVPALININLSEKGRKMDRRHRLWSLETGLNVL